MQTEADDINKSQISENDIHEMEEKRIEELNRAGINEDEVLDDAHNDGQTWISHFQENITVGKADLEFAVRQQWSALELSGFTRLQKIPMTFNKIYDPVKKILGEQRKNKPDLMVRSLNGRTTQDQLDLRTDLLRTIAYQNQNDLVYQTAFKSALLVGFGAFKIGLDFESTRSFNKVVRYEAIPDATRCFWDPCALLPHKGDGNYCGRTYIMTREQFFATYPYITNPVSWSDPYMLIDYQWNTKDTLCIGEEYKKVWFPVTLVLLSNGMTVTEEQWDEAQKAYQQQLDIVEGTVVSEIIKNGIPYVVAKRQTQDYRMMHYLMLKNCIIDFEEFPSRHLPIPFVDGDSYYVDGKQYTKSFIHEAKDSQRSVNYFNSEIVNEVKNRRREQWLGTPENIQGYEQIWRNPESQIGILPAKPDPKTGRMPEKQMPWDMSPVLMQNSQRATQDAREILGFSEQEVINSRDMSGVARRERKLEGGLAAYIYFDNLNQAIAQGGRVVNDLLMHIIGKDERHLMLTKPDGKVSSVIFNHMQKDGSVKNTLEEGDYDVEIDAGPSFSVQKEIALEMFQQTLQAFPQAFPLIADLWAKNLDVQFMPQIVERFKTLVPPNILAKEEGLPPPPPAPNPQEQMAQQEMMMKQQEMKNKQAELQMKQQQISMDAQQHQLDQAKLQQDAIEMLGKLQNDRDKHSIEKARLIADLTQMVHGAKNDRLGHAVNVHKAHLDHEAKMQQMYANTMASLQQSNAQQSLSSSQTV